MSAPTTLALSRLTGRPVAASSSLAIAAAPPQSAIRNPNSEIPRIIKPSAQTRWILPQLSAITPQYIESVMRGAFVGGQLQQWELFDLMEDTWPRLAKNLNEIKRAVLAFDWKIEPWAEEDMPPSDTAKERAKVVSNALWKMRPIPQSDENGFEQTIYDVLDAWGKGLSVIEVDWEIRQAGSLGDITAPRCTTWVHPVHYAWSNEGRLGLRSDMLGTDAGRYSMQTTSYQPGRIALEDFPPDKFLIAIAKAKTGSPLVTALLRPLCWWWCAANFSADWLMNLAQIFGLPFRWANYASGSAQNTIDAISAMLENMGSAGWAAFPEGTTLELKEAGNLGSMSPQGDLLDRADKQCDLMVLGQTLTSEVRDTGGALATAKVHQGVKAEVIEAAANYAAGIINRQLIPAICRLNYGDEEECPECRPESSEDEDVKTMLDSLGIAVRARLITPSRDDEEDLRQRLNLPAMSKDVEREWKKVGGTRAPITLQDELGLAQPGFGQPRAPAAPPSPGAAGEASGNKGPSGRGEGGPPTDKAGKKQEDAYNAKATQSIPSSLETSSGELLARAIAADLQPVGKRLASILQIQDPDLFKAKLATFHQDIAKLQADLARDPETARALEKIISASLVNGMTANQ